MQNNRFGFADNWRFEVLKMRRVGFVTARGRQLGFSVMVAGSEGPGTIGIGTGYAQEPREAIENAQKDAKKRVIHIPAHLLVNLPHNVTEEHCSTKILLKKVIGVGVRAGNVAKKILELVGVNNVSCKVIGSKNPLNIAYCVFEALKSIESVKKMAQRRGCSERELLAKRYMLILGKDIDPEKLVIKKKEDNQLKIWNERFPGNPKFNRDRGDGKPRFFKRPDSAGAVNGPRTGQRPQGAGFVPRERRTFENQGQKRFNSNVTKPNLMYKKKQNK